MQSGCIIIVSPVADNVLSQNIPREVKILIPLWPPDSKQD
ncbi:hypothetical protein GRAQ_02999 [Rahnella aquatilis CIP 78.65 = ATCC 33071]|nr:hypothetical protein GRAQ_02999 [Rahnella aquatilis CIP 78.65 = ATCC 33071]